MAYKMNAIQLIDVWRNQLVSSVKAKGALEEKNSLAKVVGEELMYRRTTTYVTIIGNKRVQGNMTKKKWKPF